MTEKDIRYHWGFVRSKDLASFLIQSDQVKPPVLNMCILTMGTRPSVLDSHTALVVKMPSFSGYKGLVKFDSRDGALKATIEYNGTKAVISNKARTKRDFRPGVVQQIVSVGFAPSLEAKELYELNREYFDSLVTSEDVYYFVKTTVNANVSFTTTSPASYMEKIKGINTYKTIAPEIIQDIQIEANRGYTFKEMVEMGFGDVIRFVEANK